jgi:hypothetical protein
MQSVLGSDTVTALEESAELEPFYPLFVSVSHAGWRRIGGHSKLS